MKIPTILSLVALLFVFLTSAVPTPDGSITARVNSDTGIFFAESGYNGWYRCETSAASPRASDIRQASYALVPSRDYEQTNSAGCTTIAEMFQAALSICGPRGDKLRGSQISFAAVLISVKCESGGKAGGKVTLAYNTQIEILAFHS